MPFFQMRYTGPVTWNHSLAQVVCARDEAHARRSVPPDEVGQWTIELLQDEPDEPPMPIVSAWLGDPY